MEKLSTNMYIILPTRYSERVQDVYKILDVMEPLQKQ